MSRLWVLTAILLIIIAAFTCTPLFCQDGPDIYTIDGTIESIDIQNSKIVLKSTETFTFHIPSGAKIINSDGFDIQLSDISIGNYATVDYYSDNSGKNIVKNMEIEYNR